MDLIQKISHKYKIEGAKSYKKKAKDLKKGDLVNIAKTDSGKKWKRSGFHEVKKVQVDLDYNSVITDFKDFKISFLPNITLEVI